MSGTKKTPRIVRSGITGRILSKSKEASTNKEMIIVTRAFGITARTQVKTAKEVVASQSEIALKKAKEIAARVYHAQA